MTEYAKYLSSFSKNSDSFQTHLSLIGGKYNVPDSDYDEFYKMYFEELKKGTKLHLIEKVKDSKFALFFDIDTNSNISVLKDSDIKVLIKVILKVLHSKIVPESNIDKYDYCSNEKNINDEIKIFTMNSVRTV